MDWDQYFLVIATAVASKSKDLSTDVGCVIVGPDHEIRSTGFNGFPRGCRDDVEDRKERPLKYVYTEHAERNAIYNAARNGVPLNWCTMYITHAPCTKCARGIIQAGIKEVKYPNYNSFEGRDDLMEDLRTANGLLLEAGVAVNLL